MKPTNSTAVAASQFDDEPLSISDSKRMIQLERIIEAGRKTFIEVGLALAEIRDKQFYRKFGHKTFEDYCRKKWGWERAYCNHILRATDAVQSLPKKLATIVANEGQARELTHIPAAKRAEVLNGASAIAKAEHRPMMAKDIRAAARKAEPGNFQLVVPIKQDPGGGEKSGAKLFFANRLEQLGDECVAYGDINQLCAFKVTCEVWVKKAAVAIRSQQQRAIMEVV